MCARAPHAFLPMLLCDGVPSERAIALKFGIELLERSDVLLVCGNRISNDPLESHYTKIETKCTFGGTDYTETDNELSFRGRDDDSK